MTEVQAVRVLRAPLLSREERAQRAESQLCHRRFWPFDQVKVDQLEGGPLAAVTSDKLQRV